MVLRTVRSGVSMQIVIQTLSRRVFAHKPLTLVGGGWQKLVDKTPRPG